MNNSSLRKVQMLNTGYRRHGFTISRNRWSRRGKDDRNRATFRTTVRTTVWDSFNWIHIIFFYLSVRGRAAGVREPTAPEGEP
jgi:hypothetical protein